MKLIQTGERVKGQVISKVGEERLSRSSQALLQSAKQSQAIAQKQDDLDFDASYNKAAKEAEEQAGIDAVTAVGAGYTYEEDGADSVYAQQYNDTAQTVALANIDTQVQLFSKEASTVYANDANGYQEFLGNKVKEFTQANNLNSKQESLLNLRVIDENKKYLTGVMARSIESQKKEKDTNFLINIDTTANIATQNAYEGNQEAYLKGREEYQVKLEKAVADGAISIDAAVKSTRDMDKRHNIQTANGLLDRGVEEILSGDMPYSVQVSSIKEVSSEIDEWYKATADTGMFTTDQLNKQRDSMLKQLGNANKEVARQRKAVLDISYSSNRVMNSDVMDYKNKDDKKAVENYYSNMVGENADIANPEVRLAAIGISTAKGVIPPSALSSLRRNSKSRDPARVLAASNMIMELLDKSPHLAEQFSESEVATAALTTKLIRNGVNAVDAVTEATESQRLPAKERKESGIRNATSDGTVKAYNKQVNSSLEEFMDDNLDPSIFNDPANNSAINNDYAFLHNHYMNTTGDYDTATELTNKRIQTQYGVSYISGKPEIQKLAPEMVLNKSNEPSEWINRSWSNKQDEVLTKFKEVLPNLRKEDITYQVSSETERGDPIWKVYIKDSNGILIPLSNTVDGYWLPNRGMTKQQEEAKTNYDNDVKTVRGREALFGKEVLSKEERDRKRFIRDENQPAIDKEKAEKEAREEFEENKVRRDLHTARESRRIYSRSNRTTEDN